MSLFTIGAYLGGKRKGQLLFTVLYASLHNLQALATCSLCPRLAGIGILVMDELYVAVELEGNVVDEGGIVVEEKEWSAMEGALVFCGTDVVDWGVRMSGCPSIGDSCITLISKL